ncbi:MAG: M50 family metallopeptidase [Sedimentisphaerales bacterium]|nr:M50 family metallopeptidase [Sedimentisphaerales bacterium]
MDETHGRDGPPLAAGPRVSEAMNDVRSDNPIGRAVALVLFALPLLYVATIFSTAVHEILGHGLSAVLLGGEFTGFALRWDAMGRAFSELPADAPTAYQIICLAGGVIATSLCGALLWGLTVVFRRRPELQLVLLIGASILLVDGVSYVFWNAYHPVAPGDIGRIIALCGGPESPEGTIVRRALLLAGGPLLLGVTFCLGIAAFVRMEALILEKGQFKGTSRLFALFLLLALPGSAAWLLFDWNQVAPGIGIVPNVVGTLSVCAVAVVLFWYRPAWKHADPVPTITRRHLVLSWTCLLVTAASLLLWFSDGVRWGPMAEYLRILEETPALEENTSPKIIGPLSISPSGDFLHCGIKKDDSRRYVIVPLVASDPEPIPMPYDRYLGARWSRRAGHDELSALVLGQVNALKTLRVSAAGVTETSSCPVPPNRRVRLPFNCWSPDGEVLVLAVSELDAKDGVFPPNRIGFSKDGGETIRISRVPSPLFLSWVDDETLYMVHAVDEKGTALSKVELDVDSLEVQTQEILRSETHIALGTQTLHGSLIYGIGETLFRDNEVFAVMPEKMQRPFADGGYVAAVSQDGLRLYVLDAAGRLVSAQKTSDESICIGMSAVRKSVYLTALSPENRVRVWACDFSGAGGKIILEADRAL